MIRRELILDEKPERPPEWIEEEMEINVGGVIALRTRIFVREVPGGFQLVEVEEE